jgi:hypothetical protein
MLSLGCSVPSPPTPSCGCRERAHDQRHDQQRQTDEDQDSNGESSADGGHQRSGDSKGEERNTHDHDDLRSSTGRFLLYRHREWQLDRTAGKRSRDSFMTKPARCDLGFTYAPAVLPNRFTVNVRTADVGLASLPALSGQTFT